MFAAAPEKTREVASSGHGPSVSRDSGETETANPRAERFAVAAETSQENDEESDDKKRARLVRNRESAMLSRQRKKQYVDELERKHRHAQMANAELQRLVQRLIAECEGLRHHLSLATGDPPVQRGLILEHPPPPGMGLEAPPKVAIPRVTGHTMTATPKDGTKNRPPPVRTAEFSTETSARPDLLGTAGSAPGSPEQKQAQASSHKRRRVAPGSSLAAAAAGALAVLSVVCIASERASGARRLPALSSGGFAGGSIPVAPHSNDGAPSRRLLALAPGTEDDGSIDSALEIPGMSGMSDATERVTLSALAATRAAAGEDADALLSYRFANPDFETAGRSKASSETSPPFSVPYGGPDDPWFAAFGAAGLRRAEEFRRVACAEMFRFKPDVADPSGSAGVSVVASDAFSARLRAEMDAEAEEAGSPTSESAERKETEESRTPELLPSAIPMPAAARETSAHAVMSSPSGLPAPPPRVSMSGIVDDDSSLVSVLLPPGSPAATKTKTVGAYDAASKLFVVTHSRRRGEYVTYSCNVP